MSFRQVVIRWIISAVALFSIVCFYSIAEDKSYDIAEAMAPPYEEPADEEVFAAANVECTRPAGAISGCTVPVIKRAASGDYISDYLRKRAEKYESIGIYRRIDDERQRRRLPYYEKEIAPRIEKIEIAAIVVSVLTGALVIAYALLILRNWFRIRGSSRLATAIRIVVDSKLLPDFHGAAGSRKLHRAQSDFLALKNLFDNGLISESTFNRRKTDISASVEGSIEAGKR